MVERSHDNSSPNADDRRELEELEQLAEFLLERGRISKRVKRKSQGDGQTPQDGIAPR